MTVFPIAPPASLQAYVTRALAIVEAIQAKALAALLAGDNARSEALQARAARVERKADTMARGWF